MSDFRSASDVQPEDSTSPVRARLMGKPLLGVLFAFMLAACGTLEEDADEGEEDDPPGALEAELEAALDRAEAAETRADRAERRIEELEAEMAELRSLLEGQPDEQVTVVEEGQPVRLEDLRVLVLGVECMNGFVIPYDFMDDEEYYADGQYCAVNLQVENVGNEPAMFPSDWDHLVTDTEGRTHNPAQAESVFAEHYWIELNPTQSVESAFLFDIPRDVTPEEVVFREWGFEGSDVRVALPDPEWMGQGDVEWQTES